MPRRIFLILVIAIGLSGSVWADGLPLTYTVTGTGGLSQPVSGFSNTPFWWINTSGATSGSALTSYGFSVTTGSSINDQLSGSLMLSSPFTLGAGDTLNLSATALRAAFFPYPVVTFGLLLQGSQLSAVLFNVRPDGITCIDGAFGCPPVAPNTSPSPGVTTTTTLGNFANTIVVGGVAYGAVTDAGSCANNCLLDITSYYTPGAGTYQLLFGTYYLTPDSLQEQHPTALAVGTVAVPEPNGYELLLCAGLLAATLFTLRRLRPRARGTPFQLSV